MSSSVNRLDTKRTQLRTLRNYIFQLEKELDDNLVTQGKATALAMKTLMDTVRADIQASSDFNSLA